MKNPYTAYERHPTWKILKNGLDDLVSNQDVLISTAESHVIGYLMSKIVCDTPVVIDWASCDTEEAFYDLVLPQCGSPSWHGRNLDALNDSWVTGGIDTEGPPYAFCFFNSCEVPAGLEKFREAVEGIASDSVAQNNGQIQKRQKS